MQHLDNDESSNKCSALHSLHPTPVVSSTHQLTGYVRENSCVRDFFLSVFFFQNKHVSGCQLLLLLFATPSPSLFPPHWLLCSISLCIDLHERQRIWFIKKCFVLLHTYCKKVYVQ